MYLRITFIQSALSISFCRIQYRKDAQNAYQQRMLEAHAGHADFPRVRTFRKLDSSTNNVFDDLKEAERWTGIQGKVDMAELTWEQRERILRLLFAKMNGFKEKRRYGNSDWFAVVMNVDSRSCHSDVPNEGEGMDEKILLNWYGVELRIEGPQITLISPPPPTPFSFSPLLPNCYSRCSPAQI